MSEAVYNHMRITNKMNNETALSVACAMSHHDICKINTDDVRTCGCKCHARHIFLTRFPPNVSGGIANPGPYSNTEQESRLHAITAVMVQTIKTIINDKTISTHDLPIIPCVKVNSPCSDFN
jgi:hypothetical protein